MDIATNEKSGNQSATALSADGLLLDQFIKEHDQDAFAVLMKRHGAYILAVCRHLTAHAQDAEDVFQACFLELVRKASSIRKGNSVVGWLHTVAVRLGRKARARRQQRLQKESAAAPTETTAQPEDMSWREACQVLQEEIAQLPEDLRLPIILCLFEGLSQEEAGQQLEINPRTVKDRVRRGRDQLRDRLVRRGVTLAILGTLLTAGTLEAAVPAALLVGTTQGVTAAAGNASLVGVVSPAVIGLVGSPAGLATWICLTAAAVLGLTFTAGAAYVGWEQLSSTTPEEPQQKIVQAAPAVKPEPHSGPRQVKRSFRDKQFDAEFFQLSGPNPKKYLRHEKEGLRVTLPDEKGPAEAIGVKLRYPVRGDFTVDATFEYLDVGPLPGRVAQKGWAAGVTIYVFLDSKNRDGLWLGKMTPHNQGPVFCMGHRVSAGKDRVDKFGKLVPNAAEKGYGRIRAVRKGATFSSYLADGESGEYKLLDSREVSDANATIVRFAADPVWMPNVPIDIRLIDFAMTADDFVGYAP